MKEQSKDLQFLFKQELLNNIKEKITPNTIKKKNTNNRKLDDAILNQIRINRKKNQERYHSLENQEYVNKDHCAIGRVIDEQEGLKRVIDEQEGLKRVIDEQEGFKRVIDEQENFKRVIEHRENKENLLKCVNEKREERIIKNGQIINKAKMNSQKYKNEMIREFKRIVNDNDRSLNDYKLINISENEDMHVKITDTYNGTKNKDCRKWFYILEFLKLTKNMKNREIGEILGMNNDNIRKQMDCFKKVEHYLSHFRSCHRNYHSLNLHCVYFQKILIVDWNEVLFNLNRVVQSISNT